MKPFISRLVARTSVNSESVEAARSESKGDNFYSRLAAEIVIHAVSDWRELVKKQAWLGYQRHNCNFDELRVFFKSEWCAFLMKDFAVEPERLLEVLEAELKEAQLQQEREQTNRTKRGGNA